MTRFACIACGKRAPVLSGLVECPACAGLLDPVQEVGEGPRVSAAMWRKLVDVRTGSGVWRFREWVLPEVKDKDIVTLGEGNAPLVDIPGFAGARLLVKQCGQQPTGSFKDLGMTVLVSAAKAIARKRAQSKNADGGLRALLCASTGDTSAALAAYGARAGIPVVVLLPRGKVSRAQLLQPLAHGAHVVELDGDFDACMRVVQELGKSPGFLLANSKNPLRLLGQATVAYEIARDLADASDPLDGSDPWLPPEPGVRAPRRRWRVPDVVVVPSGNLGNVAALHMGFALLKALRLVDRIPRLVAAQVAAADPLHRARDRGYQTLEPVQAGETLATAIRIGDPVSFPRARTAILDSGGTTTSASEDEVKAGMRALDRTGLLACPQTGAALAGVSQLVARKEIGRKDVVVLVSTASGLKFSEAKAAIEDNEAARAPASAAAVLDLLRSRLPERGPSGDGA